MTDSKSIRSVAVAGGGIVGWSAAAALKRRLPALSVSVIATSPPANALAECLSSTLPSIIDFHQDLGLSDADTIIRAGSGYRLGTRFENWSDADYVHAYGSYGAQLGPAAFHQYWVQAAKKGAAGPFDVYSAAAVVARKGRFAPPDAIAHAGLGTIGYGLRIDPGRYRSMMRAFALHLGTTEIIGPILDVRLNGDDGSIAAVGARGGEVAADLYIDATGPDALLRSRLDDRWEDWSAWLSADRILVGRSDLHVQPSLLDRAVVRGGAWWWQAAAPGRTDYGIVYSSSWVDDGEAEKTLRENAAGLVLDAPVTIRQGRWSQPWLCNCLAIGDAAVAVEPLEWTNLHLAHGAIDRLVAMMPDRDFHPVELWDYNRQVGAEADRVRDFLILHYRTARREPASVSGEDLSADLPTSLSHTLEQFQERGRLPFYEEETFSRDSWLAVLLGQSVMPRRVDPLTDEIAPAESKKMLDETSEAIASFVERLPKYSDHLQRLGQRAA